VSNEEILQYLRPVRPDRLVEPEWVVKHINRVLGERLQAERDLAAAQPRTTLTAGQARALVDDLGDLAGVLADADPKLKRQLYQELGLVVHFDPSSRIACASACVGGGTATNPDWRLSPWSCS